MNFYNFFWNFFIPGKKINKFIQKNIYHASKNKFFMLNAQFFYLFCFNL